MYTSVLVPLDGSKRSEAILPHIECLAHRTGAKVILTRVIEPEPIMATAEPVYARFNEENQLLKIKEVASYLASRCGELREKGIETKHLIRHGGPVIDEIINAIEREDVDMVAMASHGRTGLARVLFGSVAAGVLHRIDRPLLIIRSLENGY